MITSVVLQVAVPRAVPLIVPKVDAALVYSTKQSALQKGGKLVNEYIEKRNQAHDEKRARNNGRNQAKKVGKGEKRARKGKWKGRSGMRSRQKQDGVKRMLKQIGRSHCLFVIVCFVKEPRLIPVWVQNAL